MNLPEDSLWEEGIYQLEENDVVRGGPVDDGGISNMQAQQLGNRTKWLYDHLGRIGAVTEKTVNADMTLGSEDLYNAQVMLTIGNTGKTLTLDTSLLPDNSFSSLSVTKDTATQAPGCVKIELMSLVSFLGGSYSVGLKSRLWLYLGESISFTKLGDTLFVTNINGAHDAAGEIIYKPFQPNYGVAAKGQLVSRANYPRLFQYADSNYLTIPDATWLSTPAKQGLFAVTGVPTNFRLPDLRGVFIRGLDNGRGLDIDRLYPGEGIYQPDDLKTHSHLLTHNSQITDQTDTGDTMVKKMRDGSFSDNYNLIGKSGLTPNKLKSGAAGGVETRPKNIAYTAYLRF